MQAADKAHKSKTHEIFLICEQAACVVDSVRWHVR